MARKRTAGATEKPEAATTIKLTITIPADLAKRFSVHATMLGLSYSELLSELIQTSCRRFVVSDRQGRGPAPAEVAEVPAEDAA